MKRARIYAPVLVLALLGLPCAAQAGTVFNQPQEASLPTVDIVYQTWHDDKRNRDVPVKLYAPKTGTGPFPVVIFSHGLGGTREAAIYLGDYWSQHGYFCVFLQHPGSDAAVWQSAIGQGRDAIMEDMKAAANAENLIARIDDVKFAINQLGRLNADGTYKGRLNLDEIAIAGHSFGAGTALCIAGQKLSTRSLGDPRVKAAIYLCPPRIGQGTPQQVYAPIKIPGMLLTGTKDNSPIGRTTVEERRIPFDGIRSPHQYLVNFNGATHYTFGGSPFRRSLGPDAEFHRMIDEITTEFLDATLKHDNNAWRWLDSNQATTFLGNSAAYERK